MTPLAWIMCAAVALGGDAPSSRTPLSDLCDVTVREREGETLCTVRARNASVDAILGEICARAGCDVKGLDAFDERSFALDVALDDRPLSQVVHAVLGAAGLRASVGARSIRVSRDVPDDPALSGLRELDEAIEVTTLRALRAAPKHADAARAELRLGEVQERRESTDAALSHYRDLARAFPRSDLAAEALVRAGEILLRARRFKEAATEFAALANLPEKHAHQALARVELARCLAHTGDSVQALFMLDALDGLFPAANGEDERPRLLVRARALVGSDRAADAWTVLQRARELGEPDGREVLELAAEIFDHLGEPARAARLWLAASRESLGELADQALANAARSARAAGDEVAVLFIDELARDAGAGDRVADLASAARHDLNLRDDELDALDPTRVIERARDELDRRLYRTARVSVERIYRGRTPVDTHTRADAALIYARALAQEHGVDAALAELAAFVRALTDVEQQKRVFVLAGELYEQSGRFEEAAAAYGGKL